MSSILMKWCTLLSEIKLSWTLARVFFLYTYDFNTYKYCFQWRYSRVHYLITLEAMPNVKEEINSKVNKYPNNLFFCNKSKKTTISCDFQVLQVIYGFKGYKVQQLIKLQDRKQSNCCAFFCTLKMLTRLWPVVF